MRQCSSKCLNHRAKRDPVKTLRAREPGAQQKQNTGNSNKRSAVRRQTLMSSASHPSPRLPADLQTS